MLIVDRKTLPWAIFSAALLAAAIVAFVWYTLHAPARGTSGGTWPGIIFGSVAAAMLLLALLLGARKKLRTWRIGRAHAWMQMHVWLGLLCYPIAYFHIGALGWGAVGSLSWVVMLLLTLVWLSGLIGLALQQLVPKLIFERVAREVTYEQHPHVLRLMRDEAAATVAAARHEPDFQRVSVDSVPAGAATSVAVRPAVSAADRLEVFVKLSVLPFLDDRPPRQLPVRSPNAATGMFRDLRRELPATMLGAVDDLELLVDERRQMLAQRAMHRSLHWWLFAHVPLSYALAVLVALHAVFAFKYVR